MHRSDVSKAIAKLEAEGIIVRGPKAGRSATFRLNPSFGWKGSASNHQKALRERMKASNISGVVPSRDPNTVDFIAGQADAERGK
jgi:DNA-binding GntR family transcriptional regulator